MFPLLPLIKVAACCISWSVNQITNTSIRLILGLLDKSGTSLTPTIITNVKPDDDLFKEEIFSAASILIVVNDEDDAVRVANATPIMVSMLQSIVPTSLPLSA